MFPCLEDFALAEAYEENDFFQGTQFLPATYLQSGGVSAFLGYLMCLIVSSVILLWASA